MNGEPMTTVEPRTFGPDARIRLGDLVPGVTVWRRTDQTGPRSVYVEMPCHDDQTIILDPAWPPCPCVCRVCKTGYEATLVDEGDGGWAARFVVTADAVKLSTTRRAR